jgi:hypothetical protein
LTNLCMSKNNMKIAFLMIGGSIYVKGRPLNLFFFEQVKYLVCLDGGRVISIRIMFRDC